MTFCARTSAPSRSGSTHTRTFGTPSTVIMQFGQRPEQQRRPRGRWYLKLREKTRRSLIGEGDLALAVDALARLRLEAHQTAGVSGIAASCGADAPARAGGGISVLRTSFVRV